MQHHRFNVQPSIMKRKTSFPGIFCVLAGLLVVTAGCRENQDTKIPEVPELAEPVTITRFEDELLADTMLDAAKVQALMDKYPAFAEVYFNHVVPGAEEMVLDDDPERRVARLQEWVRHPRTRWLYDTVKTIFPDLKPLEAELSKTFAYAKHYFPDKPTPRFFSTISDFGYFPFVYAEDTLRDGIGISLEMFLGETFPYMNYTGLNNAFSDYLVRSYNKDHITRRVLEVWLNDLASQPGGQRLIDLMIHNGKVLYAMKQLMPAAPDSVIIDWPQAKLDWVVRSEREVWYHFTTGGWLYESARSKIQKYIAPAPRSPGMPEEAPGNTGSWLGWRIVTAYMRRHPDTSLEQLFALKDAQKLMDESGYRPPRE
jgi:hypothetical protein